MSWPCGRYGEGVGAFAVVAEPGLPLDEPTIRAVGETFASYVDDTHAAPFHAALADLLAEPMDPSQLLNAVVALANVAALIGLTLGQDDATASDLVNGVIAKAANDSFPEVFTGPDDAKHGYARALICRVYGTADGQELPDEVSGELLVALAAYADAAMVLSDRVGLPREVVGPALGEAAAGM